MKKKALIGMIIALAVIGLAAAGLYRTAGLGGGKTSAVNTVRIEKGEISSYTTADGVVEEVDNAEVFFDTPMKVKKVLVEVGQNVKKGQKLLELDLDALNSQLETLKINRETQKAALSSKALDTEVERALNNLQAAERNYNEARKAYEDNKLLYESKAISKAELDMSEKALKEADTGMAGLKNARLAYNSAAENRKVSRKTAEDSIRVMDIQINDLNNRINNIRKSSESPMDGVVAKLGVQEGAFTNSMQAAYEIINPDRLQVRAKVKEFDIKYVALGQKARITGDAISNENEMTGTVKSISPVAVTNMTASGSETVVEVLLEVNNSGEVLKPGINVTCEIATVGRKDVLLVPMEALTLDKDDNNMVFTVDEKTNTMMQKKVKIGINSDMYVEILEGLKEGDLVILDPQPSFKNGARVKLAGK